MKYALLFRLHEFSKLRLLIHNLCISLYILNHSKHADHAAHDEDDSDKII